MWWFWEQYQILQLSKELSKNGPSAMAVEWMIKSCTKAEQLRTLSAYGVMAPQTCVTMSRNGPIRATSWLYVLLPPSHVACHTFLQWRYTVSLSVGSRSFVVFTSLGVYQPVLCSYLLNSFNSSALTIKASKNDAALSTVHKSVFHVAHS